MAWGAATDYSLNGANWGETYPLCKLGKEQTPIDLTRKDSSTSESMMVNGFGYKNYPNMTVSRNAGTIVIPNVTDGTFEIDFPDGSKSLFTPAQFHFHAPSEHSVNGKLYDLEMHIVHFYKDQPGALGAVIGIFFDREAGGNYVNPFIESLQFDATADPTPEIEITDLNLSNFLAGIDFSKYWSYPGSLTTPPCTEGIKWSVVE